MPAAAPPVINRDDILKQTVKTVKDKLERTFALRQKTGLHSDRSLRLYSLYALDSDSVLAEFKLYFMGPEITEDDPDWETRYQRLFGDINFSQIHFEIATVHSLEIEDFNGDEIEDLVLRISGDIIFYGAAYHIFENWTILFNYKEGKLHRI